jgi:dTDP-glucose 4,6-dehydratase
MFEQTAHLTHENFWGLHGDAAHLPNLGEFDTVIHLAAETHVDNSITDPVSFLRENVDATVGLLEWIRGKSKYDRPLLLHVSTDEVYGDTETLSEEDDPFRPSSPYAASKAAAEHFVAAYGRTFGLRYRIVRPSNCYGKWQFREKLIPKTVRRLLWGKPMSIHGSGNQTRTWLHVEDCAEGILAVLEHGEDGEAYNLEGPAEASVGLVVATVGVALADGDAAVPIATEPDARPGMDERYGMSSAKTSAFWSPTRDLVQELRREIVQWYAARLAPPSANR